MKETSYYELKMPDSNDTIDVSVLNNNMKRLDDVLILTVIGRTAETSEFVKKCCAPYIMIQNLGEETVTIYDRRWPEDMWEDNKIVIEPTKFYIYRVANSVNANFLVLDNKECNFRYFITAEQAIAEGGGGGGGGTTDYNELDNQPKVNGIVLVGNKSFKELGLLNDDGKIKSDYLPPFVDNMDSYDTEADFPRPGVEDRLYLDKSTNLAYIWTGTDYACIGTPLALGITHETAGYGDESRAAYNHSLSEHARVDATKTEASSVNGKIKINGTDVDVYTHPQAEGQEATNPHGTTASDVGLGNLLNAKQVTVTEQAYSDTEKAQARKNIGAGTSSFSGKYSDLTEIPSEFTPAEHNHDDLYAHKTSVSSGDTVTANVLTIPENAQAAGIMMIGGKTVKDGDVLKSAPVEKVISLNPVYTGKMSSGYIAEGGTPTVWRTYIHSVDYTPIKPGDRITIDNPWEYFAVCFYTANKTYISRPQVKKGEGNQYVDAPANAAYFRFHVGETTSSSITIDPENHEAFKLFVNGKGICDKTELSLAELAEKLPDYGKSAGNVYNYIDNERGVYVHNVGSIDLGSLTWESQNNGEKIRGKAPTSLAAICASEVIGNIVCDSMDSINSAATYNGSSNGIAMPIDTSSGSAFYMYPYKTSAELKGVIANFELRTPEEIPLSSLISPLVVEPGGTIEFVNEHNLDVPNKVIYKKEV